MFPIIRFFGKRTSVWRKKVKDITVEVDRMYVRWIMSKFEIQQQDKYLFELQKRKEFNDKRYILKYKEKQQQAFGYDTLVLSTEILLLVITWVVSIGILHGSYSISDFVLLTGLALLFQRQVFDLQQNFRKMADDSVHIDKLMDTFAAFTTATNHTIGEKFIYKKGDISIHHLDYGYNDAAVFQDFSVEIYGSTKTAFVGVSGAGKSTLIKLLA